MKTLVEITEQRIALHNKIHELKKEYSIRIEQLMLEKEDELQAVRKKHVERMRRCRADFEEQRTNLKYQLDALELVAVKVKEAMQKAE